MDIQERAEQVYQLFKQHLDSKSFHYDGHDNERIISLTAQGEDFPMPVIIRVIAERQVIQIISPIPGAFPEEKRVDAAVAVATINNRLMNGCFDLDMSDGAVRFRLCQSFFGIEISEEVIIYLLTILFATVDEFNDSLLMMSKGLISLDQFIEKTQQ